MGLFQKSNEEIRSKFEEVFNKGSQETESEFLDSLNAITTLVELEDSYSTNRKLKIYELLSQISNCSPKERHKYAKRLLRIL